MLYFLSTISFAPDNVRGWWCPSHNANRFWTCVFSLFTLQPKNALCEPGHGRRATTVCFARRPRPPQPFVCKDCVLGRDPTRGLGQEVFKISRVEPGRARRGANSHGLGRVRSGDFLVLSRVGSFRATQTRPDPREETRHVRNTKIKALLAAVGLHCFPSDT